MNKNKILSLAMAGAIMFSTAAADEIIKFEEKSSTIVKELENTKTLYITNREELSDAISGGVLVTAEGSGLLTIGSEGIDEEEQALIEGADEVYIIGGPVRVPQRFENFGNFQYRFSGQSRFETAVEIANHLGTDRDLVIVNGYNYVDSITSTSMLALENRNVLLVGKDSIHPATKAYLEAHGAGKDLIFVGGENSISSQVKEEALKLISSEKTVEESTLAGADRYETSLKIAQRNPEDSNLVLANGYDFEMAINAVNFFDEAQTTLLASSENKDQILEAYKQSHNPAKVYSIGDPGAWVQEDLGDEEPVTETNQDQPAEEVKEDTLESANPGASLSGQTTPLEEETEELTETKAPLEETKEEIVEPIAPEPSPAERFIAEALKMEGWAYSQSMRNAQGYADCSSLVNRALINSGLTEDKRNLTSHTIWSDPRFTQISFDDLKPGDVLHSPGHLAIFMGEGRVFEAKTWGVPAGYGTYAYRGWNGAFRIK